MEIGRGDTMKDIGTNLIETDRLILRRFVISDAVKVYNGWTSDENTSKYVSWDAHKNVDETMKVVSNWIKEYESDSYNWVVEIKETKELIGNISVISVSKKHHNCEVGYCYGSKYWNKGFATEALKAVINYMLNECEMHIVEAKHYSTNPASGRVMEKAKMIKEAILKERRYNETDNSYIDLICYYIKK